MTAARTARPARYVDRAVVGTPDHVANVLRSMVDSGRLVAATAPRPATGAPGAVTVVVRLHAPAASTSRAVAARASGSALPRRYRRRPAVVAAVVVLGLALAAGLFWLVLLAVQALISALPFLIGVALALYALSRYLTRAGVCCPGMHCPGCKH